MTRNKIFEIIFGKLPCFVIAKYDDDYFEDDLSHEEIEAIKERMKGLIKYIQNEGEHEKLQKIKQIVKDYDGSTPSMIKQFSEIQEVLE